MTAPVRDGLTHLGVLHDDVDELVARSLPEIRSVLDAGGDVQVTAERSAVRELRLALGVDAERIRFPSPAQTYASPVPDVVARLRRTLRRDRRTLLLGQYLPGTPPVWDSAHAEDTVNVLLRDLPLTVLCACSREGDPHGRALTERSHPQLLAAGGRIVNDAFRAPETTSPAPLSAWGEPVTSMTVDGGGGLAALRARVAAVAARVGLDGEARDAAVLAAHEAVLLAAGGATPATLATRPTVAIRAVAGVMVTEARGPGVLGSGRRHELLAQFCERLTAHRTGEGCRVTVLSGPAAPRTTGRPSP